MKVIRAQKAGFCFGVALALRKLDKLVRQAQGLRVATFGEIIHNPTVLRSYADQGVACLEDPAEATQDMAVLIRAHGIPRYIEEMLQKRVGLLQDATCPKVKKAGGARLFLYGETEHPEVQGLISYACGEKRIFSSFPELQALAKEWYGGAVVLAAQTTQDRAQFEEMKRFLAAELQERLTVLDTICDATRQRQEEISMLARMSDAVVVAGGRSSGNTRRLAELARMLDVPTMLVESEKELDPQFFSNAAVVALTAGASTPREIIDAVEERLLRM